MIEEADETLQEAQRRVLGRGAVGLGVMALAVTFLFAALTKHSLGSGGLLFVEPRQKLNARITAWSDSSALFAWLWELIPTWHWVYILYMGMFWLVVGVYIIHSAQVLQHNIRKAKEEQQRARWLGRMPGYGPASREMWAMVIPAVAHERWYKKVPGAIGVGVLINLIVEIIKEWLGL